MKTNDRIKHYEASARIQAWEDEQASWIMFANKLGAQWREVMDRAELLKKKIEIEREALR